VLDGVGSEGGDVAAEVFDGEEEALIFDDGDADCVEIGIEEIGAVGGSGHPDLLEGGGSVSVAGEVFGDGAEAGSGVGAAGDEVGFSGVLVEELAWVADDPAEMSVGSLGEWCVPVQGREVVLGAGLVGELEEGLLGGGGAGLGAGVLGWEGKDCEDCEGAYEEQRSMCVGFVMHACG